MGEKRTIWGDAAKNPCAYCHYHHGYLTVHQLKTKECLNKQCNRLQKLEHEYWAHRERIKAIKRKRKEGE